MAACVAQPEFEEIGMSYSVTENYFDVHGGGEFFFASIALYLGNGMDRPMVITEH